MVDRRVVVADRQPDDRVLGQDLDPGHDLDLDPVCGARSEVRRQPDRPGVAPDDLEGAAEWTGLHPADLDPDWSVDERVGRRRRVVVGVADVTAVDEPADAGDRQAAGREGQRSVIGDLEPDEAVGERPRSGVDGGRNGRLVAAGFTAPRGTRISRSDRAQTQRRGGDAGEEGSRGALDDPDSPAGSGIGRGGVGDRRDQAVDVQDRRVGDSIDVDRELAPIAPGERPAVDLAGVQLAAVDPPGQIGGNLGGRDLAIVERPLGPLELLDRDGTACHVDEPSVGGRALVRLLDLDQLGPGDRARVEVRPGAAGDTGGPGDERRLSETGRDLARLGEPDENLIDDSVDRAGADGVVSRVLDDPPARQVEVAPGPGQPVEGKDRLSRSPQEALGLGGRRPDVDMVGDDAHQDVGP